MDSYTRNTPTDESRAYLLRNAGDCALGAVLMLYFGFGRLTEPTGDDLFAWCNWFLYHTVRIGGITLVILSLWSLLGHRIVLLVDAVVSFIIAAVFLATGAGMLLDGGDVFNTILTAFFGVLFGLATLRNYSRYMELASASRSDSGVSVPATREAPASSDPHASLAQLQQNRAESRRQPEPAATTTPSPRPPSTTHAAIAPQPPPPEGFLAGFANKEPPRS